MLVARRSQLTTVDRGSWGISFPVDRVTPTFEPLPEVSLRHLMTHASGEPLVALSHEPSVVDVGPTHALVGAVHMAFAQHRPLVFSPDMFWATILHGVAIHVREDSEALRSLFVRHEGMEPVLVKSPVTRSSSAAVWEEAITALCEEVSRRVRPEAFSLITYEASTTGPVERTVSRMMVLGCLDRYFEYVIGCICGIPRLTLLGRPDDWRALADRVRGLSALGLGWWTDQLAPLLDKLTDAAEGRVDRAFFQAMYKPRESYGPKAASGWLMRFFPYLCENGSYARSGFLTGHMTHVASSELPSGLCTVPFLMARNGKLTPMEMLAGLVGAAQNPVTMALSPQLAWAIRRRPAIDIALERLEREHLVSPPSGCPRPSDAAVPPDLVAFYARFGGATLFPSGNGSSYCVLAPSQIRPVGWLHELAFCALSDGSQLSVGHDESGRPQVVLNEPGALTSPRPVVARSFTEFLSRALDGSRMPYFRHPRYRPIRMALPLGKER